MPYKGDTEEKATIRPIMWENVRRVMGKAFYRCRHLFLAYRGADALTLLDMDVLPDNVWAIERNTRECRELFKLRSLGIRIFDRDIVVVVSKFGSTEPMSVFLDYLGTVSGRENTTCTQTVVSHLREGSVITLTHTRSRDVYTSRSERESHVMRTVKAATKYDVVLVQSIAYQSRNENSHGMPMLTMSYYIGKTTFQPYIR